jgi:hypothetical protein
MSIARISCMPLVVAVAFGAFMPAAHAQASSVLRPGESAGTNSPPIQVAELVRKKHGNEATWQKHAKETTGQKHSRKTTRQNYAGHRATPLKAHAAHRRRQHPGQVADEPGSNSILFRLAPYTYTLA